MTRLLGLQILFPEESVTFHTRAMHLLHGVGASAKMPVFWHFVCIINLGGEHGNDRGAGSKQDL